VMGIGESFAKSFAKSQIGASNALPSGGKVFLSLADHDKLRAVELARAFTDAGFSIAATSGTHKLLGENGVECEFVYKISEGRPNIEDKLKNGEISLVINTSDSKSSSTDAAKIRQSVLRFRLPYFTTMKAAIAATRSICSIKDDSALEVKTLQEYLSGR